MSSNQEDDRPRLADGSNHNDIDLDSLMEHAFVPALMDIALAGNYGLEMNVDRSKVMLLLELTDYNVDLAAQLYWDDFLATRQREEEMQQRLRARGEPAPPQQQQQDARGHEDLPHFQEILAPAVAAAQEQPLPAPNDRNDGPAVMELLPEDDEDFVRRLDGAFERAHRDERRPPVRLQPVPQGRLPAVASGPDGAPREDYVAAARRFMERARRLLAADNDAQDDADGDQEGVPGAPLQGVERNVIAVAQRAARRILQQPPGHHPPDQEAMEQAHESVSVSDDEMGGAGKRILQETGHDTVSDSGGSKSNKKRSAHDDSTLMDNKRRKHGPEGPSSQWASVADMERHGFVTGNDWIWDTLRSIRRRNSVSPPTDLLWGLPAHKGDLRGDDASGDHDNDDDTPGSSNEHDESSSAQVGQNETDSTARNIIADDDGDDASTSNPNDNESPDQTTGIPKTWLNASFQLDKEAMGLAIFPPQEDDIGFYAWQSLSTSASATGVRASVPPPYHCRALTAIVSIVTALIHTGVCVHNRDIVNGWRKPFLQLDKEERKREFHERLADALTCLLVIAANASSKRKEVVLQKIKKEALAADKEKNEDGFAFRTSPAEKRRWQLIEKQLKLFPTCNWRHLPAVRVHDGQTTSRNVHLTTSYTHVDDLKAFVLAQMNQFTSSGGVALFLENVIRFHGRDAVNRMISLSRGMNPSAYHTKCLVCCTCEDVHKKKLEECTTAALIRAQFPNKIDTSPLGHSCCSIELLSLLLTGRVHSSFEGWSAGPLGIGLLTNLESAVSKGLTRPEKPVWILRGPTCYSVLWSNQTHAGKECMDSRTDRPGSVAMMTHWNPWYDIRRRTDFRLIVSTESGAPPHVMRKCASVETNDSTTGKQKTLSLTREQLAKELYFAKELSSTEYIDPQLIFSHTELEGIVANPEDQKLYPGNFKLWTYAISEGTNENWKENTNLKRCIWKPYHRLSDREKVLVEAKIGPKIKMILWRRWPRATIDSFTPDNSLIVV